RAMRIMKSQRPILLLVDNRTRDAHGILLVYNWLRSMGCRVVLCNKRNWKARWRAVKPSVVVLSYTDGAGMEELLSQVAKVSRIALIPEEGAIPDRDFVVLERYTGIRKEVGAFTKGISKVFLWGPQTAQWLLEAGVFTPEQIVVSGSPRFDPYLALTHNGTRLWGDDHTSRAIGFATGFEKLNVYHRNNFLQLVDERRNIQENEYYDAGKNIEDYVWFQTACMRTVLDIIEQFAASSNLMYIRPSPYEMVEGYTFLKEKYPHLIVSNSLLVWEWLTRLSCLVTFNSTTGIEALLIGVPVISPLKLLGSRLHDHMNLPTYVNPPFLRFYWQPETLSEAIDMLKGAKAGQLAVSPQMEGFTEYVKAFYDWPRPEPSSLTIARELAQLAEIDTAEKRNDSMPVLSRHTEGSYVEGVPRSLQDLYRRIGRWLPPIFLDLGYVAFDLLNGNSRSMQRYHFYSWHRQDFQKAKQVWTALQQVEQRALSEKVQQEEVRGDPSVVKQRAKGE
ncbi:MAG: hypothetical protein ACE5JL_13090, partial [Dehalococcoidia bacterium]